MRGGQWSIMRNYLQLSILVIYPDNSTINSTNNSNHNNHSLSTQIPCSNKCNSNINSRNSKLKRTLSNLVLPHSIPLLTSLTSHLNLPVFHRLQWHSTNHSASILYQQISCLVHRPHHSIRPLSRIYRKITWFHRPMDLILRQC